MNYIKESEEKVIVITKKHSAYNINMLRQEGMAQTFSFYYIRTKERIKMAYTILVHGKFSLRITLHNTGKDLHPSVFKIEEM